jgi:small conductance mechanosensitive channel
METLNQLQLTNLIDLYVIPWAIRAAAAAAIWVVGRWLAQRLARLIRGIMVRAGLDTMLVQFLGNIINIVLLVVVTIAALDHLGVPTTSMLAVFGAAGLAVGLALRDSLSNFAAGVMLIVLRPFKVGDFVEVGGLSGTAEEIGIFSTVLRTADNRRVIMPNGQIANDAITNYNALPTRRIDLTFGVAYGDDLRHAKDIIQRELSEDPRILTEPEATITLGELGDSSVIINVRPWVNTEDYWAVRAALLENVKLAFDAAGVTIPFPQRDVHLHQIKAA